MTDTLIRELPDTEEELLSRYETEFEDDNIVEDEPELEVTESYLEFIDKITIKCLSFAEALSGVTFYPYQAESGYRLIQSVLLCDGDVLTLEQSRQSGKSEVIANCIAALMILLPRLAKAYPKYFGGEDDAPCDFSRGWLVGVFAPTDEQADTVWGRVVDRLTSDRAVEMLLDPEIDDKVTKEGAVKSKAIKLRSCKSLCRRQTCNPKAKVESKTYHFIVIDECFPAETPVLTTEGWVPIGDIVNGDRRDWIVATQDADGGLGWGNVKTGYRTPRHNQLVRVDHEHGSVYATANHPFMVDGKAVPAISLAPGTNLSLVSGAPELGHWLGQGGEDVVLQQSVSGSVSQSDARSRSKGEDGFDAQGDWAPPQGAGRQWSWDDRAAAEALARSRGALGRRACLPHWRTSQGRVSSALQNRFGAASEEDCRGDRRHLTLDDCSSGTGCAQGPVAEISRVVRVEILESGSDEFAQFSDGADFVYTLEVDSASHTYIAGGVLVANCQDADSFMIEKSIEPMLASTNGTMVLTGTPARVKGKFWKKIQQNRRHDLKSGVRRNHFWYDYKFVCKYNKRYRAFIAKKKVELGEDSDEFQLSYACKWILDSGMFVTEDALEACGDKGMKTHKYWFKSPVVVGIDPARTKDSTVVTVVWVDWNHPDAFGFYEHRVLNWLEINNVDFERQYVLIADFLAPYNLGKIGVDTTGMGAAVYDRIKVLYPDVDVIECPSDQKTQGERWKHLKTLIERHAFIYPAHAATRRTRPFKRFFQQMIDLEVKYVNKYMLAEAPDETDAHDDYADATCIACSLSLVDTLQESESFDSPWFRRGR